MQSVVLALALSTASAFVAPSAKTAGSPLAGAKEDLIAYQAANPSPIAGNSFWDPLGCTDYDFWGMGNEATIGYLRHAEIKHGRVAMAAFVGFCVQSTPIVAGEHLFAPYKGYVAGCSPQEQWDHMPAIGKLQILVFVGMLESYGEGAGNPEGYVHYTKGGLPGFFPEIAGRAGFGQVGLNLWNPFNLPGGPSSLDEAGKVRGRQVEINNGRLAMLGIFSLLSESVTPGSVPGITLANSILGTFPTYDDQWPANLGNTFGEFDIFSGLPYWQ